MPAFKMFRCRPEDRRTDIRTHCYHFGVGRRRLRTVRKGGGDNADCVGFSGLVPAMFLRNKYATVTEFRA